MGEGGQRHVPAVLPPAKTRYPLYRKLGGPQGRHDYEYGKEKGNDVPSYSNSLEA